MKTRKIQISKARKMTSYILPICERIPHWGDGIALIRTPFIVAVDPLRIVGFTNNGKKQKAIFATLSEYAEIKRELIKPIRFPNIELAK